MTPATSPLPRGSVIGILGGGQLGRLIALAAARLGFDAVVYAPRGDNPAMRVAAQRFEADWTDTAALTAFAEACDVITLEFENVPVSVLAHLQTIGARLAPGQRSLEMTQDRLTEKRFLRSLGIDTAGFAEVSSVQDLDTARESLGSDGFLKTRRDGYDGHGQVTLKADMASSDALERLGNARCIYEARVGFESEFSVIVARAASGETHAFEPSRNVHGDGILRASHFPSGLPRTVTDAATEAAIAISQALGHVGVLAVEFFYLRDGSIRVNEIAPRVHNSGHWTPEACTVCQFEQHVLAVAGWPLRAPVRHHDGVMENLLGADIETWPDRAARGEMLTLYGKREVRPGRKMGHSVRLTKPASTR